MARTDAQRGVWKAPAGIEASFSGVQEFTYTLTDGENGQLNPLGLNCLRSFPVAGQSGLGRAHAGGRRPAGLGVEVPAGAPARRSSSRRASTAARSGWCSSPTTSRSGRRSASTSAPSCRTCSARAPSRARSPREAYFVKCDRETTTQNDINLGIVNILVGFAPLKPAEFVIIQIQQMAGQVEA